MRFAAIPLFIFALLLMPARTAAADFELACLGATGGDLDGDLTCFLARPGGAATWSVLLDGGSIAEGAVGFARKAGRLGPTPDPGERAAAVADLLSGVEGILLTHSHLDHVGGFSVAQTVLLSLNTNRNKPSFRVIAAEETLAALRDNLYGGPIWGSFFGDPADGAVLAEEPLALTGETNIGGFTVRRFDLDHKVPASAFLLTNGTGSVFLYCGDTGPLPAGFWEPFRPALAAGTLKGLAIECSFPAADHESAERTTHLTRDTLLLELAALTGVKMKRDLPLAPAAIEAGARAVAARLPFPILVNHLKPAGWRTVNAELDILRKAGLRLFVAERGLCYSF